MNKIKIFFIAILIFPCLLLGVDSDNLDLPSVTIEGKDKLQQKDEFRFDDDLSEQWQIEGDVDFDAELQNLELFPEIDNASAIAKQGFLDLWLGYGHRLNLKGVYHHPVKKILNFEFESKNYLHDEDWYSFGQSFLWTPYLDKSKLNFRFDRLDAKADSLATDVSKGEICFNLSVSDSILQSVGFSFITENINQDYYGKSLTKDYVNFSVNPKGTYRDVAIDADFFYFNQKFNAELDARKEFNKWGFYNIDLWMGLSDDDFMPSVVFSALYFLPGKIYFSLENNPSVSKLTYYDLLADNYAQNADFEVQQELTPLDFNLKLGYKRYLVAYSNLSYKMNHIYYNQGKSDKDYIAKDGDFLLNNSGVTSEYKYRTFDLSASYNRAIVVNRSKDYIPYEAGGIAKVSVSHTQFEKFVSTLVFEIDHFIKNEKGEGIDDKLKLNFEQVWKYSAQLSFNLKFVNLLDSKINKYSGYPNKGEQFYGGVKWYF